jgi:ABC-2 type transport system permease protein
MNGRAIFALLRHDLVMFFSNRFIAVITVLAVVAYAAIYLFMPADLDESFQLALYAPEFPTASLQELADEGLEIAFYDSEAALRQAVLDGDEMVGAALPPDFVPKLRAGEQPAIVIFYAAALPPEFRPAYRLFFEEFAFAISGKPLQINFTEQMLGDDRGGEPIAYRDRMLPLFAVFMLAAEVMGLASLIAVEISTGTIRALLVTPLRVEGVFLSKGALGVGMAFLQVVILMAVTGGLAHQPLLVLLFLLMGSVLVTGIGFLVAAVARDAVSAIGWGILPMLGLSLPAFGVLFPGTVTGWAKIIPSYFLVHPLYQLFNYNAAWADVSGDFLALTVYSLAFLVVGVVVLKRKFR